MLSGYIEFVVSAVWVSVNLFSIRHLSGTSALSLRILKLGTNVGYDSLYCEKKNWSAPALLPFIVHCSFFPVKILDICVKVFASKLLRGYIVKAYWSVRICWGST